MSKEIHGKVTTHQKVRGEIVPVKSGGSGSDDYNHLKNKPSIEGVELRGDKTLEDLGITRVFYHTVEYWNDHASFESQKGCIYIYSNYKTLEDGTVIPGVKIGTGNAYVLDLPFVDEAYARHILDNTIHVSQADRDFWDNKVTCFIDPEQLDKLVFSKE